MKLDTFLIIASAVSAIVSWGGHIYFRENVFLTYKEQRVGGKAK